jgi:protein-tyrosine phosphatase
LGRLAISPRPAPHEWLHDHLAAWRGQGADIVVSMLDDEEMQMYGLVEEPELCREVGLDFRRFPVSDHGLPDSADAFVDLVGRLHAESQRGRAIVVHCFAGIGRSSLVAASVLVRSGLELPEALERISDSRGITVPDTPAQHAWLESLEARLRPSS